MEPVFVQTFVPELAIETFDKSILCWLARLDQLQLHAAVLGPPVLKRGITEPVFTTQFFDRNTGFSFFEKPQDLGLGIAHAFHVRLLA